MLFFASVFFDGGSGLVKVIHSDKWLPSLRMLHVHAAAISFGFVSPLIGPALDTLGNHRFSFEYRWDGPLQLGAGSAGSR